MTRQRIFSICLFAILLIGRTLTPYANAQESGSPKPFTDGIRATKEYWQSEELGIKNTAADRGLLADAADGRLDNHSFAEALLIASGVTEKQQREKYLDQLNKLEREARSAIKSTEKPIEQGKLLLEFLHSGPMSGGYASKQTNLHTILETGKFNCVSSAALFNLMAHRIGLQVRAVEIPEHVFSIVALDDKWADVETTNALGFDPSRDPEFQKKITKPGGTVYMPEKHKDLRREVDQLGLVAIIYYNHGVQLTAEGRHGAAIIANYSALGLDRANQSAIKNLMAEFTNWPIKLSDDGKFEEALAVQTIGLETAPEAESIVNNRKVVWQEYADAEMKAGNTDKAVAVLRRAAADMPNSDFIVRQADLFIRHAQPHIANGNLNEALAVCQRGLTTVDAPAQEQLRKWQSIQVHNHVYQTVSEKINEKDYQAALAAIVRHAERLNDEQAMRSFQRQVYDAWAGKEAEDKNWRAAVEVYASALEQLPEDDHLTQNTIFIYSSWAQGHIQEEKWNDAIGVYQQGLERFPENSHLAHNLAYCQRRLEN